jgi:tRNA A37 threonylcarbamoyladenosine dehydratase
MTPPPQFERSEILIGREGVACLAGKHVFLAGLGGVGSWCAEALARAGIGRLTLADMDVVAVSNINRQLPALLSTVGRPKAEVMAERIRDINPDCRLTLITEFLTPDNIPALLPDDADYVIDCIDSLNCKVALIVEAHGRGLPVAASMGAGNKLDVTRVKVSDIAETEMDPLARVVRKRLRKAGRRRQRPGGLVRRGRPPAPPAGSREPWPAPCGERHHRLPAAAVRTDAGGRGHPAVAGGKPARRSSGSD